MVWTVRQRQLATRNGGGYWLVGDRDGVLASGMPARYACWWGMRTLCPWHSRLSGGLASLIEPYDVYNSAVAHREHLPSRCLAAPLPCSLGASHHEPDENPISENHDFGDPNSRTRVFPTPVPGKDLLSTLAGRGRVTGRSPPHVGVENIAEGREIGGFQCHPHLARNSRHGFRILWHWPTSSR